jgi:hypothetical protein
MSIFFKRFEFLYSQYICTLGRIIYRKIFKKKYKFKGIKGRRYLSKEEGNTIIGKAIREGKPFMIARFGSVELKTMTDTIAVELGIRKEIRKTTLTPFCNNAGFFPRDLKLAEKFGNTMKECSSDLDVLAVWNCTMEPYVIKRYCKNAILINPYSLEPYYFNNPWSKELAGKKVLVIHPFAETIEEQYNKRDLLFDNKKILPDFELKTLKAVQSIGGQNKDFQNWFEALEYMEEKIKNIEFDVAIIGCGAYGFVLASFIKRMGKIAIHIGGATQLIFGIKGHRWTDHPSAYPELNEMFNEYWVFPKDTERPEAANSVENACYW